MIRLIKNKDDLKDLEELTKLQSQVKRIRLEDKLGKQGYNYDTKQLFEPRLTDTSQKLLEVTKINTKAIENPEESNKYVKTLESINKNEVICSSLIRPIAKRLEPRNKSQFRLVDDPEGFPDERRKR